MRHRNKKKKLGRTPSHRRAMLNNMVASLFLHKQIKTTHPKAKEARRLAERFIPNRDIVKMLFDEIAPHFAERNGGYTRVIKLGFREGDGAPMSVLELVDMEKPVKEEKKSEKKEGIKDKLRKVSSGKSG